MIGAWRPSPTQRLQGCRAASRRRLRGAGLSIVDRGILHRRPARQVPDRHRRQFRLFRAWLGDLLECRQDAAELGVAAGLIRRHGAVSEAVALAMAVGCACASSRARIAIAVTGIAGPGGAIAGKPVGTVWIAWGLRRRGRIEAYAVRFRFRGGRDAVRRLAVAGRARRPAGIVNEPGRPRSRHTPALLRTLAERPGAGGARDRNRCRRGPGRRPGGSAPGNLHVTLAFLGIGPGRNPRPVDRDRRAGGTGRRSDSNSSASNTGPDPRCWSRCRPALPAAGVEWSNGSGRGRRRSASSAKCGPGIRT